MRVALLIAAALTATAAATAPLSAGGRPTSTACAVTVVSAATRPPKPVPPSFNYGNGKIAVNLNPTNGRLVAGRLAEGGSRAVINPDGSIYAKFGWWRAGSKRPTIVGWRLGGEPTVRLHADVPGSYGYGFQATGLTFPTTGCWRVTGRFGNARLTFTVLVTKSPLGR